MNREKILIEIVCAGIDKAYDCIVPRQITAKELCENFLGILEDHIGIRYGEHESLMLLSKRTGIVLHPDNTLDGSQIDSGDTLYII